MPERIPNDHPSVRTHRTRLARSGGTRRPCLRVPAAVEVDAGNVIRLALDGTQYHATVAEDSQGRLIRGAFDNRRLARESDEGDNRLLEWTDAHGLEPGDSVEFDSIEPGFLYGLRVPGERSVYEATEQPDRSLADIARGLEES